MRLFLAATFNDEMTKALLKIMHDLKVSGAKGNFIPAQNLHLTLTFIGETDRVDDVKRVIESVPVPPMRIALEGTGMFGDVLWIGVKGNQKLKGYVNDVRKALDAEGINYDHEKFVPHISIVRKFTGKANKIVVPKAEMSCTQSTLMKSDLSGGKAQYKAVKKFGK